jgi:hypothetical protein
LADLTSGEFDAQQLLDELYGDASETDHIINDLADNFRLAHDTLDYDAPDVRLRDDDSGDDNESIGQNSHDSFHEWR